MCQKLSDYRAIIACIDYIRNNRGGASERIGWHQIADAMHLKDRIIIVFVANYKQQRDAFDVIAKAYPSNKRNPWDWIEVAGGANIHFIIADDAGMVRGYTADIICIY